MQYHLYAFQLEILYQCWFIKSQLSSQKSNSTCVANHLGELAAKMVKSVMHVYGNISEQYKQEAFCETRRILFEANVYKQCERMGQDIQDNVFKIIHDIADQSSVFSEAVEAKVTEALKALQSFQFKQIKARDKSVRVVRFDEGHWFICPKNHVFSSQLNGSKECKECSRDRKVAESNISSCTNISRSHSTDQAVASKRLF